MFHVANAHDAEDGTVVIDLVAYDTMFAENTEGPDANPRGLERWTIDPARRSVDVRTLDASPQEFPRVYARRSGRAHRYVYTVAPPDPPRPEYFGAARPYKHDLQTGERQVHDFGEGRHPGEFVFVPRGGGAGEEDDWLMGLVVDLAAGTSELAILDVRRFSGPPVARVHLPHRIPSGFHGE